jgi:nucleoside-triphosphatase
MSSIHAAPAILLTGQPGIGKSTAVQKIIASLDGGAGGFYTREVRAGGRRTGFEIVTLQGETAWLATKAPEITFAKQTFFAGFKINLGALESLVVPTLRAAAHAGNIVVVDEIGPMEIFSKDFCDTVWSILNNAYVTVIGTIVGRPYRFADDVKRHPRVTIKQVTLENRSTVASEVCAAMARY